MRKIFAIVMILVIALNVVLLVASLKKEANREGETISKSLKEEVKGFGSLFFSSLIKF